MWWEDIKDEVRTVPQWKLSFVRRDGNKVAHVLSKLAVQHDMDQEWVAPPECIRDLLLLEQFAQAQCLLNEMQKIYSKKIWILYNLKCPATGFNGYVSYLFTKVITKPTAENRKNTITHNILQKPTTVRQTTPLTKQAKPTKPKSSYRHPKSHKALQF